MKTMAKFECRYNIKDFERNNNDLTIKFILKALHKAGIIIFSKQDPKTREMILTAYGDWEENTDD